MIVSPVRSHARSVRSAAKNTRGSDSAMISGAGPEAVRAEWPKVHAIGTLAHAIRSFQPVHHTINGNEKAEPDVDRQQRNEHQLRNFGADGSRLCQENHPPGEKKKQSGCRRDDLQRWAFRHGSWWRVEVFPGRRAVEQAD